MHQGYLQRRQVRGGEPPRFQVLWGVRAHAGTSGTRVLEVLATIQDTKRSAFPNLREEALTDGEGTVGLSAAARAATSAKDHACCRARSRRSSHVR